MDAKIQNRDICIDDTGNYEMAEGIEEIIQQIKINICACKGKFIYDRNLGSLCNEINTDDIKEVEMLVNESLINMNDVYAKVRKIQRTSEGLIMYLNIFYKELIESIEVTVYDNI